MKIKTIFAFLLLSLNAFLLPAQKNVKEMEKSMSFGTRPGFRLEFPGATTAILESQWKDWALKNHNARLKKKGNEWFATGLTSKKQGYEEYSVYSTIEKITDGAALNVWFDLGESFLNSRDNPSLAKDAKNALQQFYHDIRRTTYDEQIKEEEKKLKVLEEDNAALDKNTLALQKSIEDYKAKIKKAEDEIARLSQNQEKGLLNIENQRKKIEDMKRRKTNVESERN